MNGSLWTIPIELLAYVCLLAFFIARLVEGRRMIGVALGWTIFFFVVAIGWKRTPWTLHEMPAFHLAQLLMFFLWGAASASVERIPRSAIAALLACVLVPSAWRFSFEPLASLVAGPILVRSLRRLPAPAFLAWSGRTDLSYGTYLY
ncbi:MAG: hypothetical protein ABI175_30275, partial [Polyangiales bacterium]